ncbi:MAG: WCX domain-containing protein [Candidatus Dormibacteria bacterium]
MAAPADQVSRLVPSSTSMVEPAGAGTEARARFTFGAHRLDWAAAFLIDLGLPFSVQEPAELRGHLLALGRRLIVANGGE